MLRLRFDSARVVMSGARLADAVDMQPTQRKRKKIAATKRSWADAVATPAPSREEADDLLARTRAAFRKTKGGWASDVLKLRKSGRAALTWSESDSARKPDRKNAA